MIDDAYDSKKGKNRLKIVRIVLDSNTILQKMIYLV